MVKMEVKEGTSVFTSGGKEVGKIGLFILDPATNEVTHFVVQKGGLFSEDKVVPLDMVHSATEDKVMLGENIESFDRLPAFEETHYVRVLRADVSRGGNPRYVVEQSSLSEKKHRKETVEADVGHGGMPRYVVKKAVLSEKKGLIETMEADVSRGGKPKYKVGEPSPSEKKHREETVEADVSRGGAPRYSDLPSDDRDPPPETV